MQPTQHPDWQPHDIAVLTPDVAPYAPYIEAVFQSNEHALPYSLSDTKQSRHQPLFKVLEHLLDLLNSRFEVDTVLKLLDHDILLRRFDLSLADLPLLHASITDLNIRWGANAQQRAQHNSNTQDNAFTWQQGIERVVLGWLLPENNTLWQGHSPWHTHPEHQHTLNQLIVIIDQLTQTHALWQTAATVLQWVERVRTLIGQLCDLQDSDHPALEQLEETLNTWIAHVELAGFTQKISINTACEHLRQFLSSQNEAGFLRGGITFCGMVPMRSLPFKAVCLLGLNDGHFPRNTKAASFDLIAQHPRPGDRARRDDDRYLFLEALLSARDILYLSYVGRNPKNDDVLAPSVLINELIHTIATLTQVPATQLNQQWVIQHPLQAFSARYFSDAQLLSSRQDYAQALNALITHPEPFFTAPSQARQPIHTVEHNDFIRFWRNPLTHWLNNQLHWHNYRLPTPHHTHEPFFPDNARLLDTIYLNALQQHLSFDDIAQTLHAQSQLPTGELGKQTQHDHIQRLRLVPQPLLHSPKLPTHTALFTAESGTLNCQLNHLYQDGQMVLPQYFGDYAQRRTNADTIELLLLHVMYCALTPEPACRDTHYISLNDAITLPAIEQATAQSALTSWLAHYHTGQNTPLPFFPRTSLQTAIAWFVPSSKTQTQPQWETSALTTAENTYHRAQHGKAQANYPEVKLIFGRNHIPPYLNADFRHLIEQLFTPLVPCLRALKEAHT